MNSTESSNGKPITITRKNIHAIMLSAIKALDSAEFDTTYPRYAWTRLGLVRLESNGDVIPESWDRPPIVYTLRDCIIFLK